MGATLGLGEIFGGGVAPAIGGFIAKHYGLPMAFFAAGMLVAGAAMALLLRNPDISGEGGDGGVGVYHS